jgi:GNAT superfamily N-acetyltransferase
MPYKVRKLLGWYQELGPRKTADLVLSALRSRIYREEEHVVLFRALGDDAAVSAQNTIDLRRAGAVDSESIIEFSKEHFPPKVTGYVRNYLENGYLAYLGFRGDELIGLFWWVDHHIDPDHPDLVLHELQLAERDVYGFSYFLAPTHRGGGTATEFVSKVFVALHEAGYTRIWGWVLSDNLPARWLFSLTGYQESRSMRFRTLFSVITVSERRALVRNLGWRSRHKFGQRRLISLPRSAAAAPSHASR